MRANFWKAPGEVMISLATKESVIASRLAPGGIVTQTVSLLGGGPHADSTSRPIDRTAGWHTGHLAELDCSKRKPITNFT